MYSPIPLVFLPAYESQITQLETFATTLSVPHSNAFMAFVTAVTTQFCSRFIEISLSLSITNVETILAHYTDACSHEIALQWTGEVLTSRKDISTPSTDNARQSEKYLPRIQTSDYITHK